MKTSLLILALVIPYSSFATPPSESDSLYCVANAAKFALKQDKQAQKRALALETLRAYDHSLSPSLRRKLVRWGQQFGKKSAEEMIRSPLLWSAFERSFSEFSSSFSQPRCLPGESAVAQTSQHWLTRGHTRKQIQIQTAACQRHSSEFGPVLVARDGYDLEGVDRSGRSGGAHDISRFRLKVTHTHTKTRFEDHRGNLKIEQDQERVVAKLSLNDFIEYVAAKAQTGREVLARYAPLHRKPTALCPRSLRPSARPIHDHRVKGPISNPVSQSHGRIPRPGKGFRPARH